MQPHDPTRREFLRTSTAAALSLPLLPRLPLRLPGRTKHVVVVAFAGGVRAKDCIGTPANVPNLMRIAKQGVTMPNVRCRNVGHYGAALSIFTGNVEVMGIRDDQRGLNPTVFEYLRKDGGLQQSDLWLSTANGAQGRLFAHSDHPDYGAAQGANVLDGDGLFNVEFQKVLQSFGKPKVDGAADQKLVETLGNALERERTAVQAGDPAAVRRIEKFILEELTGANSRVTGPGAGDAKAIRVGLNLMRVFKPRVLGIALQNADVAHGSYNAYVEVIRRNDEELGKLWDGIQADPDLKDVTTLIVLPEFGRDRDLNQRNGLDHGDDSDELKKVFLVAAGPDTARDKVVRTEVATHDVCPTVLAMFTKAPGRHVSGKPIRELLG